MKSKTEKVINAVIVWGSVLCCIAGILLVFFKSINEIDISWFWALAPFWVPLIIGAGTILIILTFAVNTAYSIKDAISSMDLSIDNPETASLNVAAEIKEEKRYQKRRSLRLLKRRKMEKSKKQLSQEEKRRQAESLQKILKSLLQQANKCVEVIEHLDLQNEQFVLDWLDSLNEISVRY